MRLPDEYKTLAETLTGAGFQCVAIVDNGNLADEFNLCQGFEVIDEIWKVRPNPEKQAMEQTERAIQRLEKLRRGPVRFNLIGEYGYRVNSP